MKTSGCQKTDRRRDLQAEGEVNLVFDFAGEGPG
jgi:hypothetical protein